ACPLLPEVHVDATASSQAAQCCGDSGNPCGTIEQALTVIPLTGGTIFLFSGTHSIPLQGLQLGGIPLTITAAPATGGTSAPPVISCESIKGSSSSSSSRSCLTATCAASSTGSGGGSMCSEEQAKLVLRGVVVANGRAEITSDTSSSSSAGSGGGAGSGGCLVVQGQAVDVTNSSFLNCTAADGGGAIFAASSPNVTISGSRFEGCKALGGLTASVGAAGAGGGGAAAGAAETIGKGGGAVALYNVAHVAVTDSSVRDCSSSSTNGGGFAIVSSNAALTAVGFSGCFARNLGGAVSSFLSNVTVTSCEFRDSRAMRGGCFSDDSSPLVSISSSSFLRCNADVSKEGDIYSKVNGGGVALNATTSFTICNCTFSHCLAVMDGGGLDALDPGNLTIDSSTFRLSSAYDNTGGGGGAVSSRGGNITIRGTLMEKNWVNSTMVGFGGAMAIMDTEMEIFNSTFRENIAYGHLYGTLSQGGVINQQWTRRDVVIPLLMEECAFERNVADFGAVGYFEGHVTVRRSRHVWNEAQFRYGGAYYVTMSTSIEDSLFAHNTVMQDGGAVATAGLMGTVVRGCVFRNNTAISGEGGAIVVLEGTEGAVEVEGSRFEGNTAPASKGGAISAASARLTLAHTTFHNNHALVKGGAVAVSHPTSPPNDNNTTTTGSSSSSSIPTAHFSNVTFEGNSATLGGAALHLGMAARAALLGCRLEGGEASNGGGVMLEEFAQLQMTRSECTGNSAPSGGGCISMSELASVTITSSNVTSNQGGNKGGAIQATGETRLTISDSHFFNNSAMDGGMLWSEMDSQVHISSSVISHNTATIQGGALYCIQNARLSLLASSLRANTAARGGAILAEGGVSLLVAVRVGSKTPAVFEGNSQHAVVLQGQAVGSFYGSVLFRGNAGGSTMDAGDGGAIFATDSTVVVVGGGVGFEGNTGHRGGAIFCDAESSLSVSSRVDDAAVAAAYAAAGGAAGAADGNAAAVASTAAAGYDESATFTAAFATVSAATDAAATPQAPLFSNNQAQEAGGAIFVAGNTSLQISDSIFESNRAATGTGGAVLVLDYAHGDLQDCTFRINEAGSDGSAVYLDRGGMGGGSGGGAGGGEERGGAGGMGGSGGSGGTGGMGFSKAAVGAVVMVSDIAGLLQAGSNLAAAANATAASASTSANGNGNTNTITNSSGSGSSGSGSGGGGVTLSGGLLPLNVSGLSFYRNTVTGNGSIPALASGGSASGAGGGSGAGGSGVGAGGGGAGGIAMAAGGLGSAFLDATFLPAMRSTCVACESMDKQDTIGTLPASFRLQWAGQSDSAAGATTTGTVFQVKGDRANPVTGLHVTVLDAAGLIPVNDFRAKASILPTPSISGLLQAITVNGRATIPPVSIVDPPESGNLSLTLSVSSSLDAFPPIARTVEIVFCPPGQFYTRPGMTCEVCPIGSWCGSGRGAEFCPPGSFSFFLGTSSLLDCLPCPTTRDVLKDTLAVTCEKGNMTVEEGFWFDFNSISSGIPAVYACDVLDGCAGLLYPSSSSHPTVITTQQPQQQQQQQQQSAANATLEQQQCKQGYNENRLCSSCAPGYYSVLKFCYQCSPTFQRLFPLLLLLIVLAWVAMGVLSDSFHTIAILAIELQMLTFIGSYNLPLPSWVNTIIQYFQIALFVPDVIGPGCTVTYSFVQQWAVTMVIPVLGVLVYACLYLTHRLYSHAITQIYGNPKNHPITSTTSFTPSAAASAASAAASAPSLRTDTNGTSFSRAPSGIGSRADDWGGHMTTKREMFDKYENTLIHGVTNWLDLSYAAVTFRCFQAFYRHWYGADVMGAAPYIGWFSETHTVVFALSVVIAVVYVAGAPVCYALVLWLGKSKGLLASHTYKMRWGWMVSRYEYDYFWWHLTCYARRIILVSIAVFGVQSPQTQVSVTLPLQAIRIGLQYGASPFAAFSHDVLNSLLALAELLFTVALTGFNYIGITTGANVLFAFSFALVFLPTLLILCYELVNWYITRCNCREMNSMWQTDKARKSLRSRKHLAALSVDDLVHPSDIARWFRPHVLSAFLFHYSSASPAYHAARRKTLSDEAGLENGAAGAGGAAGGGEFQHVGTAEMRRRRRLLLRLRDRFERIRLAGPGDAQWMKHLSKSQMYGVLSQALLGAAVGEVTVARMPVSSGSDGLLEGGSAAAGATAGAAAAGAGAAADGGIGSAGNAAGAADGGIAGGYHHNSPLGGPTAAAAGPAFSGRLAPGGLGHLRLARGGSALPKLARGLCRGGSARRS
ncbi:unnamed protein product, partial [Closterium sp. NIES-53]